MRCESRKRTARRIRQEWSLAVDAGRVVRINETSFCAYPTRTEAIAARDRLAAEGNIAVLVEPKGQEP